VSDGHVLVATSVGRPDITSDEAERAASELFGVRGSFVELGSQQDRNYRIDATEARLLLKVANPAWSPDALTAQGAALGHLASAGLDVPQVLASLDGSPIAWLELRGERLALRLLSYLEGTPLSEADYLAPVVVRRLGTLAGVTSRALADFTHDGLSASVQWDLRHAETIVARFSAHVADAGARAQVERVANAAAVRLEPLAGALRQQAVHGDLTDDNVVCHRAADGRLEPYGIIDFGDLMRSWLVGELAITCASALSHMPGNPFGILPAVQAFDELVPLADEELAALWPLVSLRAAALAVSDAQQLAVDPGNAYTAARAHVGWQTLEGVHELGFALAEAAFREAVGRAAPARTLVVSHPLVRQLGEHGQLVDLSVTSELLDDGRFLDAACEHRLLASAADTGTVAVTRYGEHRLTRSRVRSDREEETFALCVELVSATDRSIEAPWDAVVAATTAQTVVLEHDGISLRLSGIASRLAAGDAVEAGAAIGTLRAGIRMRVQLCLAPEIATAPAFATPSSAAAWRRLCPDPSPLLGVDCAAPQLDPVAVLARRDSAYARVQGRYYEEPPQIERGLAEHLIDASGRTYVDMVNNVALVGHAHPALTRAVTRQWHLLNTNSRFNYEVISEFTTRLAELAPDGLDTVLLVNSGTEATDLALRIAFAHTGREIVIAVGEAYHGWSVAADAVSTSLADNPNALDTRPPWTRFLESPNSFRGLHRGDVASSAYTREAVARIDELAAAGDLPAAFIAEAVYGNAGGVLLPAGYLAAVYDATRTLGGLCIADEVQVGYGRLGHHFFGFEQQGVVPDIITIAKAMGNGHPIGGVITRREIAESLRETGSFFSSAGGSTVSCRAGLAVLDALRDDGLQANAAAVGDHIATRVAQLAERHPLIGAMHGMGLYGGIELVRDRETLEPATEETFAICERMRELGVVVQPTSDRMNVLKVKPPLCITRASCDFVLDQLERTLVEGW
jgi:4-aminobutyrate aminotransferase-like enzyme/Ser/Thr protein kinase RdoA (MazF antagonist)